MTVVTRDYRIRAVGGPNGPRRLNVARMRRHQRRCAPAFQGERIFTDHAWRRLVGEHQPTWGLTGFGASHGPWCLDLITGDWPIGPRQSIILGTFGREELRDRQRAAGILVDGVLGPQSWTALAAANERKGR